MDEKIRATPKCSPKEKIPSRIDEFDGLVSYRQRKGLSAYEDLRRQWVELNPIYTEAELAAACVVMARSCGLILLNQLKGVRHGPKP